MLERVKVRALFEGMISGLEGKLSRVRMLRLAVLVKEVKVVEDICGLEKSEGRVI